MALKQYVLVLVFATFLMPQSNAYLDEESATKKIDELIHKVANGLAEKGKCESKDLPEDCTIMSDCSQITCRKTVIGKTTTLKVTINRCDEPVTVTINVKVKEEDIDWTHVFSSGDELAVPGLSIKFQNIAKAGLFIKTTIQPKDNNSTLKVTLEGRAKLGSVSLSPPLNLIEQELPLSTDHCGFVRWWEDRNTAERISLIVVSLLVALSIISCCFCCGCCCCCCCRKKRGSGIV